MQICQINGSIAVVSLTFCLFQTLTIFLYGWPKFPKCSPLDCKSFGLKLTFCWKTVQIRGIFQWHLLQVLVNTGIPHLRMCGTFVNMSGFH